MDNSLAKTAKIYDKFQFERIGFFSVDPDTKPNKVGVTISSHIYCITHTHIYTYIALTFFPFYFSLYSIVL